jgi:hypothetical protein
MIIEMRQYTIKPEKLKIWLAGWEKTALPLEKEILGNFLGCFQTEVGQDLNEVIFMFGYQNMADRETRRARLKEDPRWIEYLKTTVEMAPFLRMSSRIVYPTSFSPTLSAG